MTAQSNIFQTITDALLLKVFNFSAKDNSAKKDKLAETASTAFWSYTEKTGEADTTSFNGLL